MTVITTLILSLEAKTLELETLNKRYITIQYKDLTLYNEWQDNALYRQMLLWKTYGRQIPQHHQQQQEVNGSNDDVCGSKSKALQGQALCDGVVNGYKMGTTITIRGI